MTARHIGLGIGLAAMVLFLPGLSAGPAWAAQPGGCPVDLEAGPGRALAYPAVSGTAGPFAHARVTLIGATMLAGPFTGRLDVPGRRCILLAGPEDPTGLFDFFVNRVMFTPLAPGQANGIVVLYDKVHRSPGSHSLAAVLVYRVGVEEAARDPALERQLEGVRRAAQVRRRLLSCSDTPGPSGGDRRDVGELPEGFPVHPPGRLMVRFADWRRGDPHEISLFEAGESAVSPHKLPSLRWNPAADAAAR